VSALSTGTDSKDIRGNGAAYYFEGVGNYPNSHELLSVVATIHHQGIGEALNDGAVRLSEPLDSIATSRVGDVDRVPDLDVITVVWMSLLAEGSSLGGRPTLCMTRSLGIAVGILSSQIALSIL